MNFYNFASSSSGNCYWIELERSSGEPVRILIEAGITYREIVMRATQNGLDMTKLDAVLVTHSHQDHARGVQELIKRGYKVYGNEYVSSGIRETVYSDDLKVIAADTFVIPFHVEHDAPDSLGFVIYTDMEKILFVADCKYWKADLSTQKFTNVIIEANYDGQLLHYAYENSLNEGKTVEASGYKRIFNAHMSIKNCINQLQKLDLSECGAIFLIHLSDRNARELYFKEEVQRITGKLCLVAKKYGGFI
jgi:phosphoribosyl 1,2-cyclic phosphodiesterase